MLITTTDYFEKDILQVRERIENLSWNLVARNEMKTTQIIERNDLVGFKIW